MSFEEDAGGDIMKYIFITGGVVSSLGKGLTAASLGALLEQSANSFLNEDGFEKLISRTR